MKLTHAIMKELAETRRISLANGSLVRGSKEERSLSRYIQACFRASNVKV